MELKRIKSNDYTPQQYAHLAVKLIDKNWENLKFLDFNYLSKGSKIPDNYYKYVCELAINQNTEAFKHINFKFLNENKQDYLDLCEKAIEKNGQNLKYVNIENLPKKDFLKNYSKLCQIAVNARNGDVLECINFNFNNLISENRREFYEKLCYASISNTPLELNNLCYYHLPNENTKQIYTQLCQKAVQGDGFALKYVEFDKLGPENAEKTYLKLCQTAIETKSNIDNILNLIEVNNLPQKNREQLYQNLCKLAISKKPAELESIKIEYLSKDLSTSQQIYLDLAQMAVSQKNYSYYNYNNIISKVNFDNLPEENRKRIYLDLTKIAIETNEEAIKYVEIEKLPVEFQGYLNKYDLKHAILSNTDKGLSM